MIDLKEVLAKGEKAKGVIALRKAYTNAVSKGERDYLEEEILDNIAFLGAEKSGAA